MCKCVFTTSDVIHAINKKRNKKNLEEITYQTFMNHYRTIRNFLPPDDSIGPSYVFRKGKMQKIVACLWDVSYRSHESTREWYWAKAA